ncbi:hypothetical protein Syun_009711 [Stephania yunnanensis]|uniref:Uncharacterized protein n=1 Tax=Stephania yunnanensis TaxID=152371 RepID=A0AAP0PPA3_9MAGN
MSSAAQQRRTGGANGDSSARRWRSSHGERWRGVGKGLRRGETALASASGDSSAGERQQRRQLREATPAGRTMWTNGAVACCRADRSPTRQQPWTRRRDFDEARRRGVFQWILEWRPLLKAMGRRRSIGKRVMVTVYLRYERFCGYLIVARVRAGRQVSHPEPESDGLVPQLNDLLLLSGRRRDLPIECTLGALIWVCGYLIVARVKAGRQVSHPKPEFAGLLSRLNDLLVETPYDEAELQRVAEWESKVEATKASAALRRAAREVELRYVPAPSVPLMPEPVSPPAGANLETLIQTTRVMHDGYFLRIAQHDANRVQFLHYQSRTSHFITINGVVDLGTYESPLTVSFDESTAESNGDDDA